uniref:Uncharacterized protein n=1 Tax=Mola mola TaxID=94237 RepID=A0A3Q3XGF7_MOLML
MFSAKTVVASASVATFTPSSETSDDDAESYHEPHTPTVVKQEDGRGGRKEDKKNRGSGQGSPSNCASPGSGSGQGKGTAKAASGLVESLKLMSLCLSSQFHNLTGGGGVSLLGAPSPRKLDLARENHRNMKNRVLQMPLSDKTLSVNIHRNPKEGLLCTPTPHSCCQVI